MAITNILPTELIDRRIFILRGQKVMLDFHLAELYEVPTRSLNQAVKRNFERFPEDFIFQLNWQEVAILNQQDQVLNASSDSSRSQFGILKRGQNMKYLPYAFTEHGVAMLSSVLKSKRAIQVNIEIMRTFSRLRAILSSHKELAKKLEQLEGKYDHQFKVVFDAIRKLMESPTSKNRKIGFVN